MPADSFDDIYNVEPAIEDAIQCVVQLQEIAVIRTTDAGTDFQRLRPRVEIEYIHTDINQSNGGPPYYRSRLFTGLLNALVVTNSKPESDGGMTAHNQIRARLRNIFAKLRYDIANTYPELLPYHTIALLREQGTSPAITPQDGVITSQMSFEFHVNVKPDAWPAE